MTLQQLKSSAVHMESPHWTAQCRKGSAIHVGVPQWRLGRVVISSRLVRLKAVHPFDSQPFKSVTEYCFGQHQILCTNSCLELLAFVGSKLVWSKLVFVKFEEPA